MVDFSNPNICGASPELNSVLEKLSAAKADAISKLDEVASTAAAAFGEAQNELAGLKDKLQTIEIPTLPKLNLQAEIASLTSQIPGTPSFLSALAKIKTEFEDDIKSAGLELDTLVSDATKAILGGGDVCAIIPNLEKEAGSTEPAVQKPIAPKQASVPAVTEALSEVNQNSEIESNITVIKEKIKSYNVSNTPPTEDTGAFKVADEKDVKTISTVGGKKINVICHGSSKNVSTNAGFSHRRSAGVPDNYDPDIRPLPKFDPATGLITYRNSNATRKLPLVPQLENILRTAAAATGTTVVIFSGGQDSTTGTVGSARHNDGFAADIWIYKDNRRLSMVSDVVIASAFAQAAKDAGASSIGAGAGYMNGVGMHVDIALGNTVASSSAKFWGARGRSANAPTWLPNIMIG